MTKEALLQDLTSRSFIKSLVGEPVLREIKPDGTKWYTINVAETFQTTAIYKNVDFYVFDEGSAGEQAFYKDRDPKRDVDASGFRELLSELLVDDPEIVAWVYRHSDEYYQMAVVESLALEDLTNPQASPLIPALHLCWIVQVDGVNILHKKPINISKDIIAQTSILGG